MVLGHLRHKTVALLRGVSEGKSDRLWADVMNHACQMSNWCVISALDNGAHCTSFGMTVDSCSTIFPLSVPKVTCGDHGTSMN